NQLPPPHKQHSSIPSRSTPHTGGRGGEPKGCRETPKSNVTRQLESVERSMMFLRQEHLTLLHGLHMEILALQRRCSELTNDLKVKPPEIQEEEELLEARCRGVEDRLCDQECTIGEIRKELLHKGALVGALRANLKEKERHFLEELKRRSHCSTILNTELQKQTEAAAYLSFQLHAAKQKASRQGPPARACSRMERARECVPIEKVTGPAEPAAMPDPALFLHPWRLRVRTRQTGTHRSLPLRDEEEVGQQGPVVPQEDAARLVSATTAPPGAEAQAD
uniref:Coiled-coil domain containing 92B n=1 Tax=Hippocampus comes TaxID=109280 RepID=A0A3Q2Z2P1_HIPCM